MDFRYLYNDQEVTIRVEATATGFDVTVNGRTYAVRSEMVGQPGELAMTINGARYLAWVAVDGPRRWVAIEGAADTPLELSIPQTSGRARRAAGPADALEAQMPGVVRRVLVADGDAVERGQTLVVVEAMKMEIRVSAPRAGVVEKVGVAEGQAVERGQALVTLVSGEQTG